MDLLSEATDLLPFTRSLRLQFHEYPELSFQETKTATIVAEILREFGFSVQTDVGKTGVVGLMEGASDKPVFLLRFDMDALPIQEENDRDYCSKVPGVMHACGHDAHTAVGLTIARLINEHKDELPGTYKLIFQPAEEIGQGADAMIDEGVLNDPIPEYALGIHVWNDKPTGWYGITGGPVMAGSDTLTINISGRGGHGALPHLTADPIVASAQIISALQSVISRNISPLDSGVVSVTMVHGGTAENIIPPAVTFKGTIRSFSLKVRERIIQRVIDLSQSTAKGFGCEAEVSINQSTHPVINNPEVASIVRSELQLLKPDAQIDSSYQTMGSEDMASFLNRIPGVFIFVGSAKPEEGKDFPHHHPRFDIDENCLPAASALLLETCKALAKNKPLGTI